MGKLLQHVSGAYGPRMSTCLPALLSNIYVGASIPSVARSKSTHRLLERAVSSAGRGRTQVQGGQGLGVCGSRTAVPELQSSLYLILCVHDMLRRRQGPAVRKADSNRSGSVAVIRFCSCSPRLVLFLLSFAFVLTGRPRSNFL